MCVWCLCVFQVQSRFSSVVRAPSHTHTLNEKNIAQELVSIICSMRIRQTTPFVSCLCFMTLTSAACHKNTSHRGGYIRLVPFFLNDYSLNVCMYVCVCAWTYKYTVLDCTSIELFVVCGYVSVCVCGYGFCKSITHAWLPK